MSLILVGTNHKRAPIDVRERLSLSPKKVSYSLNEILGAPFIKSAVILSTCNRMEVYADTQDKSLGENFIKEKIYKEVNPYLYTYFDDAALKHLFEVASGLDSQVIGEPQILRQVRDAYILSKNALTLNAFLEDIFKKAVDVGSEVRLKTKISSGNISTASLAIKLLEEKLGSLDAKKIVLIGTGKINQVLLKRLKEKRINSIIVANRTYEHALSLAKDMDAEAIRFDDLWKDLKDADILISATRSPHLIIKFADFIKHLKYRVKPIFIFDLAVPRDIAPEIKYLSGAHLYNLEDLNVLSQKNYQLRLEEIFLARKIIQERLQDLLCLSV